MILECPSPVISSTTTLNNVRTSSKTRNFIELGKSSNPVACAARFCTCVSRRHLMEGFGAALLPTSSASSASAPNDPMDMLNKMHPPKPDWYEELYAFVLQKCTGSYEAEIAGYKSDLFANLRGNAEKILEIGVGTGPNLKYYANEPGVEVFGVDPNMKMEKYARAAADVAGLPSTSFKFIQAVGEGIPLGDESVDAVIGTLVLCSVKDVNLALKEIMRVLKPGGLYIFVEHVAAEDGTIRRFAQGILDPLQQILADNCHLTRKTGNIIAEAGFSNVEVKQSFLKTAAILNPHVYGIAYK